MKRAREDFAGEIEELGSKRSMLKFDGIDENCGVLLSMGNEEEKGIIDNGLAVIAEMDKNRVLTVDDVSCGFDLNASFDGPCEAKRQGFEINLDLVPGNQSEKKLLDFDLNVSSSDTEDSVMAHGLQTDHQLSPVIIEKRVEVTDIASDYSDSEVRIIAHNAGDKEKGKQMEVGLSYDSAASQSLGLGIVEMDNVVDEGCLVSSPKRKYSREEKGKGKVVDSWLSLNNSIDFDLWPLRKNSIQIVEPREDNLTLGTGNLEIRNWKPVALAAESERAGQVSRQRSGTVAYSDFCRQPVRQFARVHYEGKDNGNESSSQEQKLPTLEADEKFGNSPGPFSDALKMVRARNLRQSDQHLIQWRPLEKYCGKRVTAPVVPSLLDLSLQVLAENAEGIVSLELVPDVLKRRLIDLLCDMRKMDVHILNLLVKGSPTEIRIKNCSWLTEKQFQQTFGNCEAQSLRVLQLDLCGQCTLDFSFTDTLAQSLNSLSNLAIVSLRGAFHLSDNGFKALLTSAPAMLSINLGQCTLLTSAAIIFIADSLGSTLRELFIDDCPKIDAMLILPALKKFEHLEVLSVAGILTVSDQFISDMTAVCGRSIKELDLANCLKLTNHSLKIIGSACAGLRSLNISNLHHLTDLGIEYLANSCRSIHKLKLCRNGFSDEAVAAFLEISGGSLTELQLNNVTKVGPSTALSLAKCSRKLLSLDISWCRRITNETLGLIVDSCSSLKLVKVFGCTQITNGFLNGHTNPLVQIIGLKLTPILGHISMHECEEVLLCYSSLPIFPECEDEEMTRR